MSILSSCEITCHCGEMFNGEVWKAVGVTEDPDLKDLILSGQFNTVKCPKCGHIFYYEHFFIYQDIANELVAYVYPENHRSHAAEYREKMIREFAEVSQSMSDTIKIDYEPILFFGIEDLVALITNEDAAQDEIDILKFTAKIINLDTITIKPSSARNFGIISVLPKDKNKELCEKDAVIAGLEKLTRYNPNLTKYVELLQRIKTDTSCLEKFLTYKKTK